MRIIDEITNQEIANPDLTVGELFQAIWASPEAYATIDNVNKSALDDDDYEEVQLYHVWTAEEIAEREKSERQAEHQEIMNALPDAVADIQDGLCEIADMAAESAVTNEDVMDAIAELGDMVAALCESMEVE